MDWMTRLLFGIVGALLILAILAMRTGWLPFVP
jgi:hypothetical protein